jgi:hypothetical protein
MELRVTKMVLIMILTFIIVWCPYAIAVIFSVSKVLTVPRFFASSTVCAKDRDILIQKYGAHNFAVSLALI